VNVPSCSLLLALDGEREIRVQNEKIKLEWTGSGRYSQN